MQLKVLFRNRLNGLVSFNAFDLGLPNYNSLVTGSSGAGKSFLNNCILLQELFRHRCGVGWTNAVAETAKDRDENWAEDLKKEKQWIEVSNSTGFYAVLTEAFSFRDPGSTYGR